MRSSIQLVKDAYALFRSNLVLLVSIALVPMVLSYVASLFEPAINTGLVEMTDWFIYLPLLIVSAVASILMSVAMILAYRTPSLSFSDSYKQAMKYFWKYIILSILLSLILIVGFILFIIPGIIFSVWFAFATFVLVMENAGVIESLKRSKSYVKGKWWAVAIRLVVMSLIAFIIGIGSAAVGSMLPEMLGGLVEVVVSILMVPYLIAFTYLLYQDVKGGSAPAVEDPSAQPATA